MRTADIEPEAPVETAEFVIIGSGFSGMGMAIALRRAGLDDLVILERGPTLGGTWRDNVYPGCGCDVPSHIYSFSFEPNPDWSRAFAGQAEIQAYLQGCADRHGLRPYFRFDCEVVDARFDEGEGRWHVRAADGRRFVARYAIFGVGGLKDPRYPAIPGREDFEGIDLHSARWDPAVDLGGKRVGVIGTGASAVQLAPAIADEVEHLTVFQRTPPWIVPRNDRAHGPITRGLMRRVPGLLRLKRTLLYLAWELRYPVVFDNPGRIGRLYERRLLKHIAAEIDDPELVRKVTPDYRVGCKRVLLSDDWYATLNRPDVDLEDSAIARIVPRGVELSDGRTVELDALAWCTGFTVDRPLGDMQVRGLAGRSLTEAWGARPRAHLGITVAGFPNLFLLLGPNTALGHNSVLVMIEAQIDYIMRAIRHVRGRKRGWVDVREDAQAAFVEQIDRDSASTVWQSGCESWYLGQDAVNFTLWPGTTVAYRLATRRFDPGLHRFADEQRQERDAPRTAAAGGQP